MEFIRNIARYFNTLALGLISKRRVILDDTEKIHLEFIQYADELNTIGSNLSRYLQLIRDHFDCSVRLAGDVHLIYDGNTDSVEEHTVAAQAFGNKWNIINQVIRASIDVLCLTKALKPLSNALSLMLPDVQASMKARQDKRPELEACKRHMKSLEDKRDVALERKHSALASGRTAVSTDELVEACHRYEGTLREAEDEFAKVNQVALTDIQDANTKCIQLSDDFFLATVVAQVHSI